MDGECKEFVREAAFAAERARVEEAARAFVAEALPDWQVTATGEGFEAAGRSSGHAALAKFRFDPAPGGTKVAATLRVNRVTALGLMVFDVGGYYQGQLRHWLEGTRIFLEHPPASAQSAEAAAQRQRAVAQSQRGGQIFRVIAFVGLVVLFFVYFIPAVIGLFTGNLWILGNGGDMTIHGPWARIISAAVVAFFAWIALLVWKQRMRARGPG